MSSTSGAPTVLGPAVVLTVGSITTCLAAVAMVGSFEREVVFGMLAPLAATVASWVSVARTFYRDPGRVTKVLVAGFGIKLVFFGLYVVLMLRGLALRPVPFVLGFTVYFVGLHAAEAWCLQRLFATGGSTQPLA